MMFRGSLTDIRNIYWNNYGLSLKSDVSEDFPAGYLEQKNIHCVSFDNVPRSLLEKERSFRDAKRSFDISLHSLLRTYEIRISRLTK